MAEKDYVDIHPKGDLSIEKDAGGEEFVYSPAEPSLSGTAQDEAPASPGTPGDKREAPGDKQQRGMEPRLSDASLDEAPEESYDEVPEDSRDDETAQNDDDSFYEYGNGKNYGNLQDVINTLEARRAAIDLPTKEELERERRRRRTESVITGIADGASALANVIFTSQYAPDMHVQESSLTGKMKERYDKLKAEREADADKYLNYAMTIGKLKDQVDEKRYKRGRDALQDQLREAKDRREEAKVERDAKMADVRMRLLEKKIDEAKAAAEIKEIEAKYKEDLMKSQIGKNNRTGTGRGGGGGGKGRGATAKYPIYDKDGNVVGHAYTEVEATTETVKRGGKYPKKVTEQTNNGLKKTSRSGYDASNGKNSNGKKKKKIGW